MGGLLSALIGQGVNLAGNEQAGQREARQLQLQQAINAAMMAHTFAKDEAQMDYERQRGDWYGTMANRPQTANLPGVGMLQRNPDTGGWEIAAPAAPDAQRSITDPVTGKVTFYDPRKPPTDLSVTPKPQPGSFTFQKGLGPDGSPTLYAGNSRTGTLTPTGVGTLVSGAASSTNAALASKSGQFGEMLKKSADLLPEMDALDVKLGQSAANDVASAHVGSFHIPGTAGIGNLMVNQWPEYQRYQATLTPFVLANAHALSGARINQEQAQMIQRSIEMQPADSPIVRKQRIKNVVDQLNSVAASLPPEDVARQEAQMDPATLQILRQYGYRGAEMGRTHSPSPSGVVTPAKPAKGTAPKADYGIFGGP